MKTSIIIPAINEEESIGYVLGRIPESFKDDVIVVDGGSKDNTVKIALSLGARVITENRRGYGYACYAGVLAAKYELLVFLDADGADDPTFIDQLIKPFDNQDTQMVLGSRLAGEMEKGAMPWHQKFGNQLSAWLIRKLYGFPATDLSPFRAVRRQALLDLDMQEMTFGWPTEMMTKAFIRNWRVIEISVSYHQRYGGKSKISGTLRGTILATYHILRLILKTRRSV
ncbi:MAG: UDP-glucose--dolichyl-phosphate glucosyltransferase [Anaerolineaceae bacterium]|nr:UDP-glucose--dolichyl-phosphate glucosyltransferase [Anaerolineaceae bacterium]